MSEWHIEAYLDRAGNIEYISDQYQSRLDIRYQVAAFQDPLVGQRIAEFDVWLIGG